MSKPSVLIICEKWKAGHPERGRSLTETVVVGAVECTQMADVAVCHYDNDTWIVKGQTIVGVDDRILVQYCLDQRPDLIYYVRTAHSEKNPDYITLAFIRRTLNIPMVATWWDVDRDDVHMIDQVFPFIDLNIVLDHFDVRPYTRSPERYCSLWTSWDSRIVHDLHIERDIPVSFVGTQMGDGERMDGIHAFRTAEIPILLGGGQHGENWSREVYYSVLQRSKIVPNFSSGQLKGRTWEVLLCGALLLEPSHTPLSRYYVPGQEYVPYTGISDLVDKVQYYLAHEDERMQIATCGCQKASTQYSAIAWLREVFRQVNSRVPTFAWTAPS